MHASDRSERASRLSPQGRDLLRKRLQGSAADEGEMSRRLAALLGRGARLRSLAPAGAGLEERLHRVLAEEAAE